MLRLFLMKLEDSLRKQDNCVACISLMLRILLFRSWKDMDISSKHGTTKGMNLTALAVRSWLFFDRVQSGYSLSPKTTPLPSYSTPKSIGTITATPSIKIFKMYKTPFLISEACKFQRNASGGCRFRFSSATSVMNHSPIRIHSMQSGILYNGDLNFGSD